MGMGTNTGAEGFEPGRRIRIIEWASPGNELRRFDVATSEEAAEIMELDAESVEWAIEEFGRCDVMAFTAWQPSERAGIEFPIAEAPKE